MIRYYLSANVRLLRYNVCILGGAGNHSRPQIADDIVSAILKTRASAHNPAVYWSREEQQRRLEEAFQKWAARGVWNLAAAKVSAYCGSPSGIVLSLTRTFPDAQGADEAREERLSNASAQRCSIGRQPG